ncbi:unnamed protein product [Leptidea sinapis]|uniref:Uncharacterized protein n=1 Tax=Leptidea sinapis TaxID=189913 RepID=A0A5E4QEK1_9NEOP|nr:unnamed protein product [Leptidea sinapis]
MFCTNCLSNGAEENACLVCRAPCTLMKLVPDMNSDIQDYFTEPEELLKKSCDIIQFQRRHRHRLLSYLLQATKKFHTARNELKRMTEICQKQHKQLKEYQRIIKHLHTQVVTQTSFAIQRSHFAQQQFLSQLHSDHPHLQADRKKHPLQPTVSIEPRDPDEIKQATIVKHVTQDIIDGNDASHSRVSRVQQFFKASLTV